LVIATAFKHQGIPTGESLGVSGHKLDYIMKLLRYLVIVILHNRHNMVVVGRWQRKMMLAEVRKEGFLLNVLLFNFFSFERFKNFLIIGEQITTFYFLTK
jgi:hypothetical protein